MQGKEGKKNYRNFLTVWLGAPKKTQSITGPAEARTVYRVVREDFSRVWELWRNAWVVCLGANNRPTSRIDLLSFK